jgi:hypothetical protein
MMDNLIRHDFSAHPPNSKRLKWVKNSRLVLRNEDVMKIIEHYLGQMWEWDEKTELGIHITLDNDQKPIFLVEEIQP